MWNGPRQDINIRPRRDIVLSPSSSWCGGTRPSSSHAASSEGCFERRVLRASSYSDTVYNSVYTLHIVLAFYRCAPGYGCTVAGDRRGDEYAATQHDHAEQLPTAGDDSAPGSYEGRPKDRARGASLPRGGRDGRQAHGDEMPRRPVASQRQLYRYTGSERSTGRAHHQPPFKPAVYVFNITALTMFYVVKVASRTMTIFFL